MRTRPLFLFLILLSAVPVFADDVYLTNGRKFEGVVAETTDSQVRIQMQGGVLSLPKSQVLRVEVEDSSLAGYLRRRDALKKNPAAGAPEWLELARWSRSQGLGQATREAAMAAAALNPGLEGLAPILRAYGYVLDEQLDRWIPYEESMRRKGFVLSNGQWITREEYAVTLRAREAEEARHRAAWEERARAAREDRLATLTELSLTRELARPPAPPVYPIYANPLYGTPLIVTPGFWIMSDGSMREPRKGDPNDFTHVPGSLIPGRPFPATGH